MKIRPSQICTRTLGTSTKKRAPYGSSEVMMISFTAESTKETVWSRSYSRVASSPRQNCTDTQRVKLNSMPRMPQKKCFGMKTGERDTEKNTYTFRTVLSIKDE